MTEWTGRFTSSDYTLIMFPMVMGSISVTLPRDLSNVHTTARMTYDGWYRYGESSHLNFKSERAETGIGEAHGCGTQPGVVSFHSEDQRDSLQKIHFTATNITSSRIDGHYQSSNPSDKGTFYLLKQ